MVKLRCPITINHPQERSCIYTTPYKQLSLADLFTDCQNKFDNNKDEFLKLRFDHLLFLPITTIRHHYHCLDMARLLQIDVKYVAKFAFVRGNLSKRVFCRKTHRFLPLYVLGNRSIWLFLLIIWNRQILQSPQSYALRKQVRNPIASTLEILYIRFFSKFESCISCSNSSNRNFLFRLIRNNP